MLSSLQFFYKFESFVTPGRLYRFDLTAPAPKPELIREIKVKGYDSTQFETEQVFYASKDGTKVPMFIFRRKVCLVIFLGFSEIFWVFGIFMRFSFSVIF